MIAHVAEAGEGRGRVLLQLGASSAVSPAALSAALHVARAFQSEIEALFVEDRQLFDLASFPFAREISLTGRVQRLLTPDDVETELRHMASDIMRKVRLLAAGAGIEFRSAVIRDEPVRATAQACAECGPWNVVVMAEPLKGHEGPEIGRLFEEVHEFTGLVVAGGAAVKRIRGIKPSVSGSVVALVEDLDHLQPMLRTAERLALADALPVTLLLVAETEPDVLWLEEQSRLALGDEAGAAIATAVLRSDDMTAAVRELGRRDAGLAIARWGGRLAPMDGDLTPLATHLAAPVLLMR